jgi:hypothetical protein
MTPQVSPAGAAPNVSQEFGAEPPPPPVRRHFALSRVNDRASVPQERVVVGELTTLNSALNRAQLDVTGTKGRSRKSEALKSIMKELYNAPDNARFAGLISGAAPYLSQQATHIHMQIMNGKRSCAPKIRLALEVWDALWTKEEREQIINRSGGQLLDYSLIERISWRVIRTVHFLKDVALPSATTPSTQSKDQILGVGNGMVRFNKTSKVERFIPRWTNEDCPIPIGKTLLSEVEDRHEQTKARNRATGDAPSNRTRNINTRR